MTEITQEWAAGKGLTVLPDIRRARLYRAKKAHGAVEEGALAFRDNVRMFVMTRFSHNGDRLAKCVDAGPEKIGRAHV